MKKIVVTYGDLNGIGVEILIKALNVLKLPKEKVVIAGSKKVFDFYKDKFGLILDTQYEIADVELDEKAFEVGKENKYSGEHCFLCLKKACELVKTKNADNIVTAPVSKNVLNMAGHEFSGQTEILEHFLAKNGEKSEMLFLSEKLNVFLLTRHLPVCDVASKLNVDMIVKKIIELDRTFKNILRIEKPKFGVLALNPHAGENGLLGKEEQKIIIPALDILKQKGVYVEGPLVSDAAFAQFVQRFSQEETSPYDCYVAMYHDQGLIPLKFIAQDLAVNTTIGLCAIRTSPSHGTAFDIAGKNISRPQSMIEAIKLAIQL